MFQSSRPSVVGEVDVLGKAVVAAAGAGAGAGAGADAGAEAVTAGK